MNIVEDVITGISELAVARPEVYSANNRIVVKTPGISAVESVKIINLAGAVVKNYIRPASLSFDVSSLEKGMYIVLLNNNISVKFIRK
jgi:hypothetical protein